MDTHKQTADSYNKSSNLWIASRNLKDYKNIDPKLMKQNRPHFFIEKPAMRSKIIDLKGKKVLAFGCGSGEECDLLLEKGATDITGIDMSSELIKEAKKNYPGCDFYIMNGEHLDFPNETFDYIFSSLVLHYFRDWEKVLGELFRVLKPNGTMLFSTIHPIKWAGEKLNDEDGKAYATLMGFENDPKTHIQKIYGDYLNIKKITEVWMHSLEVTFYSRSISLMFKELRKAGFEVLDIYEPKAIEETKDFDINYYEVNQVIPNFIIFEVKKN